MHLMWPALDSGRPPNLAKTEPLPPAVRTSVVIAPIEIAFSVIRDALEVNAPRELAGKLDSPVSKVLSKADIGFSVTRGPLAMHGKPGTLAVTTTFHGALRVSGQVGDQ